MGQEGYDGERQEQRCVACDGLCGLGECLDAERQYRLHYFMMYSAGLILALAMILLLFASSHVRPILEMVVVLTSGFLFGKFTNRWKTR